ncbi:ABA4-like family protein [Nonomuraea sp. NPDC049695]|uniref:ABA4-like family protein n=1 Tax=Nonomuraea sp. NPDC049695 TaxID=3154734 RepID=UPI0034190769
MTSFLFDLSFYVAAPFWALMILAPTWRLTRLVAGSPLIVLPAVAVELVLLVPLFGAFWPVVTRPSLEGLQELVTRPEALTALWAQIIAWDLFLGRWMYLDSRERTIHPLVMAPMLILTILLSPIALPIYLVIRLAYRRNTGAVGAHA